MINFTWGIVFTVSMYLAYQMVFYVPKKKVSKSKAKPKEVQKPIEYSHEFDTQSKGKVQMKDGVYFGLWNGWKGQINYEQRIIEIDLQDGIRGRVEAKFLVKNSIAYLYPKKVNNYA
jgi:uncharacterized protein with FMN-binding domain